MKEFKSKIGYKILIPILILLIGMMMIPILTGGSIQAIVTMVVIIVPTIAFILHMFFQTSYQIDNNHLKIKCGFLYRSTLDISNITSISKTRDLIASPAVSLDRIELKYGKWDSVIISPADKTGFVNELMKINPHIKIKI